VLGYEESIRVPLILAGPGVPRGERRSQLVSLTDLPATFMDVAGVTAPLTQDGTSLLPFAEDPAYGRGRALLLEAGGWPYPKVDRLYTGVRTDDGRVLLRWWDGHREVYDLHRDPYELDGRVNGYERPWVSRLGRALRSLRDCVGAVCSAAQIPPR
jgi:arylsulfatase A-like enzyme